MLETLKKLKIKELHTLEEFMAIIDRKRISKSEKYELNKQYRLYLESKPERTDFISFDDEGFFMPDNKPVFKDFFTCEEASSETKKVAVKDNVRLYFTDDQLIIFATDFVTDQASYKDLAIAFNPFNNNDRLFLT